MKRFSSMVVGLVCGVALTSSVSATTIQEEKVVCGNCGAENTVTVVGSSNQMGAPDLDWRPAEMMRRSWIGGLRCRSR